MREGTVDRGLPVPKRLIKLADLLKDAAPPLSAPAGPRILLGILGDPSDLSGPPPWHRHFHEIVAAVLLVVTLGTGVAFMPELAGRLPVRAAMPLKMWNGILVLPVEINGAITLDFAVDSGAAYVSVPAGVFAMLKRAGTIQGSDLLGQEGFGLADGSTGKWNTFTIRSLKIGNIVLKSVKGGVGPSQGPLLLGQSFLQRFKSWSIDNTNHELHLEGPASD
jgi:gag-polyprotein putative aspartyl protease